MNTFLAFGREHVERHFRKTGQSVYMHLKRHVREVRELPWYLSCDVVLVCESRGALTVST